MPIDAIGQVTGSDTVSSQSAIDLDEFMRIFITQLNYQDPLDPVDNREFLAQLAEFSNLELARSTQSNISDLLEVNAITQSLDLLGKTVEIIGENGSVIGSVSSIRFDQGAPLLSVLTGNNQIVPDLSPSEIRIVRE